MVKRVFIYGRFMNEEEASPFIPFSPPLFPPAPSILEPPPREPARFGSSELSTEAIEILREPSVMELIGKVYVLNQDRNYSVVSPLGVRNYTWWTDYQGAVFSKEKFYFKAKDGDLWRVPWLRQESDDLGAYIAAALKHD
jgi:hypothetical protein